MIVPMTFIVTITDDGLYHVQNVIMGQMGQHHVHTKESFQRWKKDIDSKHLKVSQGECNCGLDRSGMVREYDGHEWFNERFEE